VTITNGDLAKLLKRHGHASAELPGVDGGSVLVCAAGARVLRLTGPSGHDFLWLNNAFLEGKGDDLLGTPGWRNLGGDRTFIGPEPDYYIRDFGDPWGSFVVPREIDPGSYAVRADDGQATMSSRFSLTNYRAGATAEVEVVKSITVAGDPFHQAATDDRRSLDVEYVGYEQVTTIARLSAPAPKVRLGLWHLTQVRAAGDILIPVTDDSPPRDYLSNTGPDKFTVEPGLVRFRVDAASMQKIGVKACSSIGRMGYLKQEADGAWTLLVRNCLVNPSAVYLDPPWGDLDDLGYCLQAYNDDSALGDFGEMEYHSPAIGGDTGLPLCTDISQLWAFRGEEGMIRRIAKRLLAVEIRKENL